MCVAMPPMDADQARPSSSAAAKRPLAASSSLLSRVVAMSASTIGSIISVVAVLLIHIDSSAVIPITPAPRERGPRPTRSSTVRATRRCSPHFATAWASRKPQSSSSTIRSA